MNLIEAIEARHSVRAYKDEKISDNIKKELDILIQDCNSESGLNIQLITDEPEAFDSGIFKYGSFKNVKNYIALVGKKNNELEEKCGFYGEKIVLKAQQLGLNTCWVAMTFSKGKSKQHINIDKGEKLLMVISLGYGINNGTPHKSKPLDSFYPDNEKSELPQWFLKGVEFAALAPTATNQQKFKFELKGDNVRAISGLGFYSKTDLGIVKYHFEIGSGKDSSVWID